MNTTGTQPPRPARPDQPPRPDKPDPQAVPDKQGPRARPDKQGPRARPDEQGPQARPDKQGPQARPDKQGPQARPDKQGPQARPVRPHTGRRRNEAARGAILRATVDLMRTGQVGELTIDAIAETAGVGRQTIYRWWPSKGALMADAMIGLAREVVPVRDTGVLAADLTDFLVDSFAGLEDPGTVRALRQLASAAQQDEHAAAVLAEFTAQRRAALRAVLERGRDQGELGPDADLDMLVDMAYGVLWYRLLVGHAPLDEAAARRLAGRLIAAGG
jgi:AcrR family transcriptional regulator